MQRHTEETGGRDGEGHGEQQMQSQSGGGVQTLREKDCGTGLEQCNDAEERRSKSMTEQSSRDDLSVYILVPSAKLVSIRVGRAASDVHVLLRSRSRSLSFPVDEPSPARRCRFF